jgi:putative acetyltransferase
MNYEIQRAIKHQHSELISIWEKSVRATHHFLSEADIQHYKQLIFEQYFDQLDLYSITNENEILGFIGLDGELIQMLFIDPKGYGLGLGKALVEFAIQSYNINSVDVNEQNEQALGFYKHMGFETAERFEQDSAGKPYPILSMRLKS